MYLTSEKKEEIFSKHGKGKNDTGSAEGLQDLEELAIGSGFGLRYDFNFFVLRFDIGFKTHDPARPKGERWFKDYNFNHAVYNVGINYPF